MRTAGTRSAVPAAGALAALFVEQEGTGDGDDNGKQDESDKKRTHGNRSFLI